MSLDYDKIRQDEETPQTSMSSYSDLFAALAFIFLFLYVISTIQLSLQAISSRLEAEKLEAKLQAYEIPLDVDRQIDVDVQHEVDYENVLKKLAILEKQAKEEAEKFFKQAQALQEYDQELIRKYQTVVKHVEKKNIDLAMALKQKETAAQELKSDFETMLASQEKEYSDNP